MKSKYIIFLIALVLLFCVFIKYGTTLTMNKNSYLSTNDWSNIPNKNKYYQSDEIKGIEVRVLEPPHILAGEKGVFATQSFLIHDVIGEYSGIIKEYNTVESNNLYIFNLIDDVVIDGEISSNELKYVNSYINISNEPNLVSRITYINNEPKVLYVCSKDINEGEELLIDYGEDYNNIHIYNN
uniref:SET domain-containing protein n=1 Tax=viral metagenome TaxID=1070528 RepID=A0A6C0B8E6_9ZZZZ